MVVAEILDEKIPGISSYQVIAHRRRFLVLEEEIDRVGIGDIPEMAIIKNKELGTASGRSFDGIGKGAVFIKDDAVVIDGIFIPGQVSHCAAIENDVFSTVEKRLAAVTGGEKDGE